MTRWLTSWLRTRTDVAVHITLFCTGLLLGSALVPTRLVTISSPIWFIAAMLILVVGLKKKTRAWLVIICMSGCLVGLLRSGLYAQDLKQYEKYIGQNVVVSGVIATDPSPSSSGNLSLILKDVDVNGEKLSGELRVGVSEKGEYRRSDLIIVSGLAQKGFGLNPLTIQRTTVLEVQRINGTDPARDFRDVFARTIRSHINEPEASLGLGFLVGQGGSLPIALKDDLRLLGLTHIIVASGYNLTILIRLARRRLMGISRYTALIAALTMIGGFVAVTGFSPSMSRAAIVAVLSLLAWYYGRKIHPLVILIFAAAVTVMVRPSYIWGDLGWYLSFLSFFGVLVVAPLIKSFFFGDKEKENMIRSVLIETTSAQLMTVPLILMVFGDYAPISLPANMVILPAIPIAMLTTFAAGSVAYVVPALSEIAALPARFVLSYITKAVDVVSGLPSGLLTVPKGNTMYLLLYVVIAMAVLFMYVRSRAKKPFDMYEIC